MEAYLQDQSIDDILAEITSSEADRKSAENQRYQEMHDWYKGLAVSQGVEFASYGILAASILYMMLIKRRRL